jgi:hypothetical protein
MTKSEITNVTLALVELFFDGTENADDGQKVLTIFFGTIVSSIAKNTGKPESQIVAEVVSQADMDSKRVRLMRAAVQGNG